MPFMNSPSPITESDTLQPTITVCVCGGGGVYDLKFYPVAEMHTDPFTPTWKHFLLFLTVYLLILMFSDVQ